MSYFRLQNIFGEDDPFNQLMMEQAPVIQYDDPYSHAQDYGPDGFTNRSQVQPDQPGIDSPYAPPSSRPTIDWIQQYKDFQPETAATDRYNQLLNNYPESNPSILRAIAAAGMAARNQPNAFENAMKYYELPHQREIADWKEQTGQAYNAANLERQSNQNERQLLNNAMNAQINQQKADETERYNRDRAEAARINALANQARAARWTVSVKGNSVMATSPDGSQTRFLGSIPGAMSEAEKIGLEGQWDVNVAAQQGSDRAANMADDPRTWVTINGRPYKPDGKGGLIPVQIEGNPFGTTVLPQTGSNTTPTINRIGTPNSSGQNQLEKNRIMQAKMNEAWTTYPDAKKYLTRGQNGIYNWQPQPVVTPENHWWPGTQEVTQKQVDDYIAFRQSIDPDWQPVTGGSASQYFPPPNTQQTQQQGPGYTPVPGGGRGVAPSNIPMGQPTSQGRTAVKREYSPSRNQTRITYSDGTVSVVPGRQ